MNAVTPADKVLSTNPLKSSAPLGAALAYLGVEGAVPLFHGSQGCTAFALVLLVRHFKEAIPLQTTAMNEVSTILGGADHVEEALLNLKKRMNPRLVGICSTALTETRGEDFVGDLTAILARRAADLAGTKVVFASTPDFDGALEQGWSKAVTALIDSFVPRHTVAKSATRVNVLAGQHLTAGDIETVKDILTQFDLEAVVLPDLSTSLDGIATGSWSPTTTGGTTLEMIRDMGGAGLTIAVGEHMRAPAELLEERTGVPTLVFETLTGLDACDRLMVELAHFCGRTVPAQLRRERDRLIDAMLDGHFYFAGRRIAIGAEPDLLYALACLVTDLGAHVTAAVTTSGSSPIIPKIPARVVTGDLGDLETLAADADLIATHSHGRQAAERLHIPHFRIGFPIFDRLGTAYRTSVGYTGTRSLIFDLANCFLANGHRPTPESLDPFLLRQEAAE